MTIAEEVEAAFPVFRERGVDENVGSDAAMQLLARQNEQRKALGQPPRLQPIPTLCHQEHLHPVGVCRVCAVAVGRWSRDRKDPNRQSLDFQDKVVPACVHPVEDGMVVVTLGFGEEMPIARSIP